MTPSEYRTRCIILEKQIDFNKRIHCTLVAARYQRQLDALKKEYEAACHSERSEESR